jgi:hypothetical protein
VIEILRYLAGLPSAVTDSVTNYCAADVNRDGVINLIDVAEILIYLHGLPSMVYGMDDVYYHLPSIRAEIDADEGVIFYIANEDIPDERMYFIYSLTGDETVFFHPQLFQIRLPYYHRAIITDLFHMDRGILEVFMVFYHTFETGEWFLSQEFEGNPYSITITGEGFAGITVIGGAADPNRDGITDINDTLEILRYLAGLPNVVRFEADIQDALEILKYLAGLESILKI